MKSIPEETAAPAVVEADQPKAAKKASRAPRRAPGAGVKAKSADKTSSAKKALSRPRKPNPKSARVREGSKSAKIVAVLTRQGGATSKDLMKATGWQAHSVRGFLSGTVGKKMGLTVVSTKADDGERCYSIEP